ncbi:MAG TPA: alpha/beta fold hydrolase [Thermoanaerobaculia bacterium]|nr:alpha/beta fold hydrolase [Thermoanaerobaculia bacterium]
MPASHRRPFRPFRPTLLALSLLAALALAGPPAAAELPRRAFLGLQVAPAPSAEAAVPEGAAPAEAPPAGVVVAGVVAGSSAAAAGVPVGARVVSVAGHAVATPQEFVQVVGSLAAGDRLALVLEVDGERIERDVRLAPMPRESSAEWEVVYGEVEEGGKRFRTLLTHPRGEGPFPTVFMVQGLGCFSVDDPQGQGLWVDLLADLSRAGYATVRVDKPGTGDSEGGPCRDVDFRRELAVYRAALTAAAGWSPVDPERLFLFGHSMGGIMAPLLAQPATAGEASPLRGAVVYGTGFGSWTAYSLENLTRQGRMAGEDAAEIRRWQADEELLLARLYVDDRPLEEILAETPRLGEAWPNPPYMYAGKHYRYFQQVADLNLPQEWKTAGIPVLAAWGTSDFVASGWEHEWLAEAANAWRPGSGTYAPIPEADHWLRRAASFGASAVQGPFGGEYHPGLAERMIAWMDGLAKPAR